MKELYRLWEMGKAPSDYYRLEGIAAILFDSAIHWGWRMLPRDDKGNLK